MWVWTWAWRRKALHPSLFFDAPYWMLIYPGELLGLFHEVNHDGRQVFTRKEL
jgi:hypothetical protein